MYFSKKQKVKLPIRMAFYYDANITVINIQLQYYTVIHNLLDPYCIQLHKLNCAKSTGPT